MVTGVHMHACISIFLVSVPMHDKNRARGTWEVIMDYLSSMYQCKVCEIVFKIHFIITVTLKYNENLTVHITFN